eukprot:UN27198
MSMVIVIAHIGMVAMRVFSGYLIRTPYKTVICTIAQCWTLLWLQGTIGKWKSPYTKTFKNFGYFVVGVMATRILIFTSTSNPGAVYFGLNSSCMEFQFPATAGLVIFLLCRRLLTNFDLHCESVSQMWCVRLVLHDSINDRACNWSSH